MLLVLVTLTLSVAVVTAVGIIGFVEVAFHPPGYSAAGTHGLGSSSPSRGWTTFEWFSATAERMTRGFDCGTARRCRGPLCCGN